MKFTIEQFVIESNRIEGIIVSPRLIQEIEATERFLALERLTIGDLTTLVAVYQPDARPRFVQGLDVRVGNHIPPKGGPHVQARLQWIMDNINDAYEGHIYYETLHPFTDGNGRSGRALWLRHMGGIEKAPLGFLHHWYYQTLQNAR